jgi:protein arginine N-methyltransferase 1
MYGIQDYAAMIGDGARMRAYAGALAETVRPGMVVADIGAGPGILGLMAAKLGARRVFAIDVSPTLAVGRELARENGLEDRIEFIQADSRKVDLPERADVVVSDLRGALPLCDDHLEVIADARLRFLSPGGVLIPERDLLWAAVVRLAQPYEAHCGPAAGPLGVTLRAARSLVANVPLFEADAVWQPELLVEPQCWGEVDYATVEPRPVSARLDWPTTRPGTGHGILLWFEAKIRDGWSYATGPLRSGKEANVYSRVLLPFEQPLELGADDRIELDLWVGPRGEPFSWMGAVSTRDGREKRRWRQSSFLAAARGPIRVEPGQRETRGACDSR